MLNYQSAAAAAAVACASSIDIVKMMVGWYGSVAMIRSCSNRTCQRRGSGTTGGPSFCDRHRNFRRHTTNIIKST